MFNFVVMCVFCSLRKLSREMEQIFCFFSQFTLSKVRFRSPCDLFEAKSIFCLLFEYKLCLCFYFFYYYFVYVYVSIFFLLFHSDAFSIFSFYVCLLDYVNVLLTNLLENGLNLFIYAFIFMFVATKQFKYVKGYERATNSGRIIKNFFFINVIIIESIDL